MRALLPLLLACSSDPGAPPRAPQPADTNTTAANSPPPGEPAEDASSPRLRWSPPAGLVESPGALQIEGGLPGARILYTTDGTDPRSSPTAVDWSGSLPLDHTLILRAVMVGADGPIGPVESGTWIFADQVAGQEAPAGWPATWSTDYGVGGYNTAWYGLSAEAASPEAVAAALRALPIVSLILDPADLFGPDGLYDHAWEEGADWERPVSVARLPFGDEPGFVSPAGLRAYGGASRYPDNTPKKTLRVIFRTEYGAGHLDGAPWGGAAERIDGFLLRAGYNNTWTHWSAAQRLRGQLTHDPHARAVQADLGQPAARGRFVHLFLDGLYWGVYDLAERPDAHFWARQGEDAESADPANWDALNSGESIDGDLVAWEAALAAARDDDGSDAGLAAIEALVDGDALIDYMLLNFWIGNTDWPYHNWYAGRLRRADGRWRFASWDAEHSLEEPATDCTAVSDAGTPAALFVAMMRHAAFRDRFAARAAALLADDGPLGAAAAQARYEALADTVEAAMPAESARWGSYRRDIFCYSESPCLLYTTDHWRAERDRVLTAVLPARATVLQAQLTARGW